MKNNKPHQFIFFTGGVISSVGKGLTAASMGRVLKERGFSVSIQKLDPYLNVDPGTMSPYQHGEVFVLDDGAETDLDLGHYERFIDNRLTKESNMTSGQVYAEVIEKERKGEYLGGTIQVIPHITDEIKRRINLLAEKSQAEIIIVEVGGTIGDIESLPFIESLRQMRQDVGAKNVFFVHTTWLPHIGATGELKTKPTQHSVGEMRSLGITPHMIIARSDYDIGYSLREKISLFCDVPVSHVIPIKTASSVYSVPLILEDFCVGEKVMAFFGLISRKEPDWSDWERITQTEQNPAHCIKIAVVGKYVELHDAYMSVKEALNHAGLNHDASIKIEWIHSEKLEEGIGWDQIDTSNGILVPGGFGNRGIEGKIKAIQYARVNKIPFLGLCLGMQLMVVEFARSILNYKDANSTEFDPNTSHPVIDLMADQREIINKGGTMRLGLYPCQLIRGTTAYNAYQENEINERHRHRYEVSNQYRPEFEKNGLIFSGQSPSGNLAEIAEVTDHPFMVACQFHPEFLSRPNRPHPLFSAFIAASIAFSKK